MGQDAANKTRRPIGQKDSERCMKVLTRIFGYSSYKGKQKEIVEAAYGGADVLVVAPTGMGKSLCFQVPAVADKRGLSVVVSPLLALMQNQLDNLRSKGVEVAALSSQVDYSEKEEIQRELKLYDTHVRVLYVTPERLRTAEFLALLDIIHKNHNLNRLVVDEAHCISEWGHNFRGDYRLIGKFRERYPDVPIMALTATATSIVQKDIIRSLKMDDNHLFIALHPFNRSNLFYEVRHLSNPEPLNQMADIFDFITTLYRRRGKTSSGIIYCRHKKTCEELSGYLRGKGLNAKPYHSGLPNATLEKTLKSWTIGSSEPGGVDLVVATIAFGLGIDKGDVRYVIHYDMPKSFEGYYQETGRAGRDGHPSKCVLYYSREDAIRVKRFVKTDPNRRRDKEDDEPTPTQRASGSLDSLIQFAESATLCRHVSICRYFGEPIDEKDEELVKVYCDNMCDVCKYPDKVKAKITKLSTREDAANHVPFAKSIYGPPVANGAEGQSSSRNTPGPYDRQGRYADRGLPPKRPSSNSAEGSSNPAPAKKLKVALAPMMVTKPFGSAVGLSKPFRPPSFVGASTAKTDVAMPAAPPSAGSTRVAAAPKSRPEPPRQPRLPATAQRAPPQDYIDVDEEESMQIDLPEVDLPWKIEESSKASKADRRKALDGLRASFHKVLTSPINLDDYWEKITSRSLTDDQRYQAIFQAAVELEQSAILYCSTLDGYNTRISSIRDDIRGMSKLHRWDKDDGDFEESQEIIQILRVKALPPSARPASRKGKERAG
ncbi:unnamed protein product [Cyclocybe aegerita]|uniref:ATP-dependent DNA helicase n=1 Tax=Cyclocybe aegerita TaxID=1973307 RepID=A0A8S0WJR3_CYCAE|nr:unnamed protein product [Cyclocybe aegerita]